MRPDDEDIIARPYDYPLHGIALHMDEVKSDDYLDAEARVMTPGGLTDGGMIYDLKEAVGRYADAVFESDPVEDKSDTARVHYRLQHCVMRMRPPITRWSESSPVLVLAVVQGPFYALALVYRGASLVLDDLSGSGQSVVIQGRAG